MNQPANQTAPRSYREAIDNLTEALEVLDRPGEGLGYAWGLQHGQAGYFHVVRARNELRRLRDEMHALHEKGLA